MRRFALSAILLATVLLGVYPTTVGATSLQLRPLSVATTLKPNENQKGFLDISNTDARSITVTTSVQGFRQLNNQGDLSFFEDETLKKGIIVDVTTTTLAPHQTMRVYYALLGNKLPEGDVSAAIFFQTSTPTASGVAVSARLGTLLSIVNGSPGARQAEVTRLDISFFQFSGRVTGQYWVKNTSDPKKGGGFFPDVSVSVQPFEQKTAVTSSLVFPGIERNNAFGFETNRFGFYAVSATYGSSTKTVWVFVMSPSWQLAFVAILITGVVIWFLRRRRPHKGFGIKRKRLSL